MSSQADSQRAIDVEARFDLEERTIWIVDLRRAGCVFIVRADEDLFAFLELQRAIHELAASLIS